MFANAPGAVSYWHLLPLVLLVSLVWGATRHESWPIILSHTIRFSGMVVIFMGAVFGFLLVAEFLPWYVWLGILILVVGLLHYTRSQDDHPSSEPGPGA